MSEEIGLDDVLTAYFDQYAAGLNTAIPGRIIEYDENQQKATVQPTIQRLLFSGERVNPQPISGVPVVFPSANTGILSFPIVPNDKVLLIFSQRSIDRWVFGEGESPIDPKDRRKHDRADCIAIPGMYTYNSARGSNPNETVLRHNAAANNSENPGEQAIHLHPTGDSEAVVVYGNKHTDQLATIKINQDGSIILTSDEGNSLKSEIKMNPDGSVQINANNGTSINMIQGGNITIDSPSQVQVNCGSADVNASGDVTVDGSNVILNGGGGGGVVTSSNINHCTGLPHGDASSTVSSDG